MFPLMYANNYHWSKLSNIINFVSFTNYFSWLLPRALLPRRVFLHANSSSLTMAVTRGLALKGLVGRKKITKQPVFGASRSSGDIRRQLYGTVRVRSNRWLAQTTNRHSQEAHRSAELRNELFVPEWDQYLFVRSRSRVTEGAKF